MKRLASLLIAAAVLAPAPSALARDLVQLDATTGNSQSFAENSVLDKKRHQYPCNPAKGARYCHKEDGTVDADGLQRVIAVRTKSYGHNRTLCLATSLALRQSNAHCDKGDRPFDRDQADGI